jgi:hypothetical protein
MCVVYAIRSIILPLHKLTISPPHYFTDAAQAACSGFVDFDWFAG